MIRPQSSCCLQGWHEALLLDKSGFVSFAWWTLRRMLGPEFEQMEDWMLHSYAELVSTQQLLSSCPEGLGCLSLPTGDHNVGGLAHALGSRPRRARRCAAGCC